MVRDRGEINKVKLIMGVLIWCKTQLGRVTQSNFLFHLLFSSAKITMNIEQLLEDEEK